MNNISISFAVNISKYFQQVLKSYISGGKYLSHSIHGIQVIATNQLKYQIAVSQP